MDREYNKEIARETLAIIGKGCYAADGNKIEFDKGKCKEAIVYGPDWKGEAKGGARFNTKVTVSKLDTVSAILSRDDTSKTMALNFASARHPGGGFESGAVAQEESLARSSTLYLSIGGEDARELYEANADGRNPFYTEHMVYSPNVLFFRNAYSRLVAKGKYVSVITAPAVNRNRCNRPDSEIDDTMRRRIRKIFDIAIENGKDDLILGAWGCGVFGNKAETIARLFKKVLAEKPYQGAFMRVEFAVPSGGRVDNHKIFKEAFEGKRSQDMTLSR